VSVRLRLRLGAAPSAHDYVLGEGLVGELGDLVAEVVDPGPCALVTDDAVAQTEWLEQATDALAGAGFEPELMTVPSGEAAKSVAEAERLWSRLAEAGVDRAGVVVSLGGGAVSDLAGFCASTWLRGVAFVPVPTTLLAMADSAVGGKTGVNLSVGKNLVGSFHMPSLVVADLATLATLPERQVRSGLAEVAKCAVLAERDRLGWLREEAPRLLRGQTAQLAEAVALAVRVKERHVRDDPHDRAGVRALLNLGHTTAHALETETGFGDVTHGEAVAVGLVVAVRIARARGLCGAGLEAELVAALTALGLPTEVDRRLAPEALLGRTRLDKKRERGRTRMVLPLGDGGAELFDVPDEELLGALRG